MSQTQRPLTEQEEKTLREYIPYFVVATQTKTNRKLHIPNGDEKPLCSSKIQREIKAVDKWDTKETEVYPIGYRDVCMHCGNIWRENNAE
jgi:hypothetical protein